MIAGLLSSIVRQKYVLLAVALVGIILGVASIYVAGRSYSARSVLVLTSPSSASTAGSGGGNPLLSDGNDVDSVAVMLIQVMNSPDVRDGLVKPDSGATYFATNGSNNPELLQQGPFVVFDVSGQTSDGVVGLNKSAVTQAQVSLTRLQQQVGADQRTFLQLTEVVPGSSAVQVTTSPYRTAGSIVVIAVIFGLAVAVRTDGRREASRRKALAEK